MDRFKKLHEGLKNSVFEDPDGNLSIYHHLFELKNISKYTIEEINELFHERIRILEELIVKEDYTSYLDIIPPTSRVYEFSKFIKPGSRRYWNINDKDYWKFLRKLWIEQTDVFHYKNSNNWYKLLSSMRSNKEYFMNESERSFLQNLPEIVTVFRGYARDVPTEKMEPQYLKFWEHEIFSEMGFSYTLSREVGLKYYRKYSIYNCEYEDTCYYKTQNSLFKGNVNKDRIHSYINERNEDEILIVEWGRYGVDY